MTSAPSPRSGQHPTLRRVHPDTSRSDGGADPAFRSIRRATCRDLNVPSPKANRVFVLPPLAVCVIDRREKGQTTVTIELIDCVYNLALNRGILDALKARRSAETTRLGYAQPLDRRTSVALVADDGGKTDVLATTSFLRVQGRSTVQVQVILRGEEHEKLSKFVTHPAKLAPNSPRTTAELHRGPASLRQMQLLAATRLKNDVGSSDDGKQRALLVYFGGTVRQKQHTKNVLRSTLSRSSSRRTSAWRPSTPPSWIASWTPP
jgi:hypothetical protein